MSIIEKIKNITLEVLEQYAKNIPANVTIKSFIDSGEIENLEVLRRICEQFNCNIYLTIFRNPNVNKYNINFDKADFDELAKSFKIKEEHMDDYNVIPIHYKEAKRKSIDELLQKKASQKFVFPGISENLFSKAIIEEKVTHLEKFAAYVEREKYSSQKKLEESFMSLEKSIREAIYASDSIADLTKIASQYMNSNGYESKNIINAIAMISDQASKDGFALNLQLTKTSSLKINSKNKELELFKNYQKDLDTAKAFSNMSKEASKTLDFFHGLIKNYESLFK